MKVLAALLVVMGLVLAIAPQFTNCEAKSGSMPVASGATTGTAASTGVSPANLASSGTSTTVMTAVATIVPKMKCLWSARGSLAVGIPLIAVGVLLFFSRRRETRRALGITGALLGLMAVLLPTSLIGVCASSAAVCNTTMRPIMLAAGGLAVVVGVIAIIVNELTGEGPGTASAAG